MKLFDFLKPSPKLMLDDSYGISIDKKTERSILRRLKTGGVVSVDGFVKLTEKILEGTEWHMSASFISILGIVYPTKELTRKGQNIAYIYDFTDPEINLCLVFESNIFTQLYPFDIIEAKGDYKYYPNAKNNQHRLYVDTDIHILYREKA